MENEQALELLNATHNFPCAFTFKVIGRSSDEFVSQVVEVVQSAMQSNERIPYSTRATPNGKHVAVTLEPHIESAELVLATYERLKSVDGVVMTM